MENIISRIDFESANNYLERMLQKDVKSIELTDHLPTIGELSDANKVFKGTLSILFVDMRKSTDLTDELKAMKMVKVYRSFIRCIVQSIRFSGGESRQFAGDGVMGVFHANDENSISSQQQAVNAARYILTMIDYCLNPLLSKYLDGLTIGCGVGISTGIVMMTKVGMRGKEGIDTAENEMSVVWTGSTTNYASRYCSLANSCEIFIDEATYNEAKDDGDWNKVSRVKGDKVFTGYVTKAHYLPLAEDVNRTTPLCAEDIISTSFTKDIFEEMKKETHKFVDEISEKSAELSNKITEVNRKEHDLRVKEADLIIKYENDKKELEISINRKRYNDIKTLFSNTYLKTDLIIQIGEEFWFGMIDEIYQCGRKIGKSEDDVSRDICHYLVDIYGICFSDYEKAYNALCFQAEFSWFNSYRVEEIVRKSGRWAKLKRILESRMDTNYSSALEVLKKMGY